MWRFRYNNVALAAHGARGERYTRRAQRTGQCHLANTVCVPYVLCTTWTIVRSRIVHRRPKRFTVWICLLDSTAAACCVLVSYLATRAVKMTKQNCNIQVYNKGKFHISFMDIFNAYAFNGIIVTMWRKKSQYWTSQNLENRSKTICKDAHSHG